MATLGTYCRGWSNKLTPNDETHHCPVSEMACDEVDLKLPEEINRHKILTSRSRPQKSSATSHLATVKQKAPALRINTKSDPANETETTTTKR